jgi:hypothetical protein
MELRNRLDIQREQVVEADCRVRKGGQVVDATEDGWIIQCIENKADWSKVG